MLGLVDLGNTGEMSVKKVCLIKFEEKKNCEFFPSSMHISLGVINSRVMFVLIGHMSK